MTTLTSRLTRVAFFSAAFVWSIASTLGLTNYFVTNNANSGAGSLRQAILDLNTGPSPANIIFAIPSGQSKFISLLSQLPNIQRSARVNTTAVTGITIDGSSAGFAHGLVFSETTVQISNVLGLTIQNFQRSCIVINPTANEQVNVFNCSIFNAGSTGVPADGILILSGTNHVIDLDTFVQDCSGYGLSILNAVSGVQIVDSTFQLNSFGGVEMRGTNHLARGCAFVLNGAVEDGPVKRGGVVMGASGGGLFANDCRVENSTLAANTPFGIQVVQGTDNRMRENETYLNPTKGYQILATPEQPVPVLSRFVVDTTNDKIFVRVQLNGVANANIDVEFFVAFDNGVVETGEGAVFAGLVPSIQLDGSGQATFTHSFDRAVVFAGIAIGGPFSFDIDNEDRIVATATDESGGRGTSEFSNPARPTLPGDFNLDRYVSGSDFLIWQQNFGATNAVYTQGDADFDGDVDNADKAIWEQNYGQTP